MNYVHYCSLENYNSGVYIRRIRKNFPTLEFPSFVRKKWKNVVEIETKFPRKNGQGIQTKLKL